MARAQPLCRPCTLRVSICLPPNKASFNEVVLFIHGKEVSEYEHPTAPHLLLPSRLRTRTSLAYAGSNLARNNQQRQGEQMTAGRNRNLRKHLLIGLVILMATSTFAAS